MPCGRGQAEVDTKLCDRSISKAWEFPQSCKERCQREQWLERRWNIICKVRSLPTLPGRQGPPEPPQPPMPVQSFPDSCPEPLLPMCLAPGLSTPRSQAHSPLGTLRASPRGCGGLEAMGDRLPLADKKTEAESGKDSQPASQAVRGSPGLGLGVPGPASMVLCAHPPSSLDSLSETVRVLRTRTSSRGCPKDPRMQETLCEQGI